LTNHDPFDRMLMARAGEARLLFNGRRFVCL
jgi:hypothetical protein